MQRKPNADAGRSDGTVRTPPESAGCRRKLQTDLPVQDPLTTGVFLLVMFSELSPVQGQKVLATAPPYSKSSSIRFGVVYVRHKD